VRGRRSGEDSLAVVEDGILNDIIAQMSGCIRIEKDFGAVRAERGMERMIEEQ
jgi:hypothetical protein